MLGSLAHTEVTHWRSLMGLEEDLAKVHLDSWGIKRMFTLQLRRWLSGAFQPRVPRFRIQVFVDYRCS